MPLPIALIVWPLVAGAVGAIGGFVVGAKANNLAIMAGSAAVIVYMIKRS